MALVCFERVDNEHFIVQNFVLNFPQVVRKVPSRAKQVVSFILFPHCRHTTKNSLPRAGFELASSGFKTAVALYPLECLGTDNGDVGKQNHLSVLYTGQRIHY